jgi:hypothetical protein
MLRKSGIALFTERENCKFFMDTEFLVSGLLLTFLTALLNEPKQQLDIRKMSLPALYAS